MNWVGLALLVLALGLVYEKCHLETPKSCADACHADGERMVSFSYWQCQCAPVATESLDGGAR